MLKALTLIDPVAAMLHHPKIVRAAQPSRAHDFVREHVGLGVSHSHARGLAGSRAEARPWRTHTAAHMLCTCTEGVRNSSVAAAWQVLETAAVIACVLICR